MDTFPHLVKAIIVIVILYALALHLRRKGTLTEEHSLTLARIVTELCLPAMIFVSLARQTIRLDQIEPAMVMLGLELACIALAWIISVWLKFNKTQQGAIVFCSAFGSSTFLGYVIIMQMFPDTPQALSEAVLISEIGVGYPIFILGPILAAYFGSEKLDIKSQWKSSLVFFKSPVFFALIVGSLWGYLRLPGQNNEFMAPIFKVCNVLASALTPLAILSVGLMFKLPHLRKMIAALTIVVLLKLILKPLIAGYLATLFGFPELWKEVLVLLAAMPPAILGAVFLRRYGGDASLASTLLLGGTMASAGSLLAIFEFIG
jgi:hypothetical protein